MTRPLSDDLRRRVAAAVDDGMSRRGAAKRFGIAPSTAIKWVWAWRLTGSYRPRAQGGDRRSQRIEARAEVVLALVEETPDMTLRPIWRASMGCGSPKAPCGASSTAAATPSTKRRTPASSNDLMCCSAGEPGSKPSPISTPESSSSSTRPAPPPRWRDAQAGLCAAIAAGRRSPMGTGRPPPSSAH